MNAAGRRQDQFDTCLLPHRDHQQRFLQAPQ
jgi:hypothetical protein